MSNPPTKQGHRRPLSETERTIRYDIYVVESTKTRLRALGNARVRRLLNEFAECTSR